MNIPSLQHRSSTSVKPLHKEIDDISAMPMHPIKATPSNEINNATQSTKLKVATQKSSIVLALIVILFVIKHCYRMALKMYTVAFPDLHTLEKFKICFALQR